MAHPALHKIERHGCLQRRHAEPVTEATRTCGPTSDACFQHRTFYKAPGRDTRTSAVTRPGMTGTSSKAQRISPSSC
jgi:hypothetical protein